MCFLVALGPLAVFRGSPAFGRIFTGILIALAGVLLGIVTLAAGRGPRTASNDSLHGGSIAAELAQYGIAANISDGGSAPLIRGVRRILRC